MYVIILKNHHVNCGYIKFNYTYYTCINWLYYLLCILKFLDSKIIIFGFKIQIKIFCF